jgi:hypothetical protein
MNTKKIIMLCVVISGLFIMSLASKASAATFTVGFSPETASVQPGDTIIVNVTIADMPSPGLFSYEFTVYYNNSCLNATAADIPSDHFLKPVLKSTNIILVDSGTINQTEGWISFAASLMYPEAGKTGSGTLTTMTFDVSAVGGCNLEVKGLTAAEPIFLDPDSNPYATTAYTLKTGLITVVPEFTLAFMLAAFAILSTAAIALKKKLR